MYTLEMTTVAVSDFTEEIYYKMQNVESEKIMEYCNTTATESAKSMSKGVKTMFAKIMANVFEEDENANDGNNPLLMDLVVRNIFKYLPMKDLISCRQICKLWSNEANIYFRQNQRIIFYPESIEKMTTFTNYVSQARKNKNEDDYQGPCFSTYCFTAQYQMTQFSSKLMTNFVTVCGQYVRKLEIFYPNNACLSSQDFTAFFITGMPNLESIHIVNLPHNLTRSSFLLQQPSFDQDKSQDPEENDTFTTTTTNNDKKDNFLFIHSQQQIIPSPPLLSAVTHLRIDRTWQIETVWSRNFLHDLLSLMPNLIDYELWTWNSNSEDDHSQPYLNSFSPQNLSKLEILRPGSIGDSLGLQIASMGLHLSKLYLPVLNRGVGADTIEQLLESQSRTLIELQLNCSSMQDSRLLTFPRMEKLRNLDMMITHPWNNDYTNFTPCIDYQAQFPKLKVLRIELGIYNDVNFINYFFNNNSNKTVASSHNLEELDISFSGFRDEKFIEIVAGIFPSIKKLRLDGYGNKIFSSICKNMQELQCLELYLIYGFNVDDQMTGIPKDVCTRILKDNNKDKLLKDIKLEEVQIHAGVSSLTKLRSFSIKQKDYQAKFWPNSQCITNITAYVALSQMKQLTYLHIESVKFTDECKKDLAEVLENCWLDFT